MATGMSGGAALEKRSAAVSPGLVGRLLEQLGKVKGAGRYVTVPGLRMRGADISAAGKLFGGSHRTADPAKYAVWLNRVLNRGGPTPDLLVDKNTPLLHNPSFIIERLGRTGWSASPEALRAAGVMQVNAAPLRSLDGGPFVATRPEMQAFGNGLFPFRSMYGRLAVGRDAAGKPLYVPWRISNHVNTVVPVREVTGASGAGKYYDALYGVDARGDPRLTTGGLSSRGSFDLFVPRGRETGVRFDWQEPYDLTGFYGGPRMGGPRDWGGIARGFGLQKRSAVELRDGGIDDVRKVIAGLSDVDRRYILARGRTEYRDVPGRLAGRTVAYEGGEPVGFSDIYGVDNKGRVRPSPSMVVAVLDKARGHRLAGTLARDAMKKVLARAEALRAARGKREDRLRRFVWRLHAGNESSARAAAHAGFTEQQFARPHKYRQFVMSRQAAEKNRRPAQVRGSATRDSVI